MGARVTPERAAELRALHQGRSALIKALAACEGDRVDAYGFALMAAVHLGKLPGAKDRLIEVLQLIAEQKHQAAIADDLSAGEDASGQEILDDSEGE